MDTTNIKSIIFDFGGVISKTLFETHRQSEKILGLPPNTLTWQGPFNVATDPLWQSMQNDEISEREYWLQRSREVGALIGEEWHSMQHMVQKLRADNPQQCLRPQAIECIQWAKSIGIRLAILSNELDLFYGADFRNKIKILDHFELIADATYTGILKPNALAYTRSLSALQLSAHQCLFIDDQLRNVRAAEKIGLHTIHFNVTDVDASFAQVQQYFSSDGEKNVA